MICALIPAAGSGSRTGLKENKIFFQLNGKTMIENTVERFLEHKSIDGVCLICAEKDFIRLNELFGDRVEYAFGGKTRGESVLNGLNKIKDRFDTVLVHDGARPFVTEDIIDRVIENVRCGQGAIAGVKVTDTVKETDDNSVVVSTPCREKLWAAQTPQGFFTKELISAYEKAGTELTDDGAVFEKAGNTVKMVEGSYANKKITTSEDVKMSNVFLSGIGYDVHALIEGRPLVIGGVKVPHEKGLMGHSDADVLVHAIMDALLGAAGLGDIGRHFPDTDEKYKGIDSMLLYSHVISLLKERGFEVVNISAIVVAQRPKLKPYIEEMRRNIAKASFLEIERVNVAATTTEHLGFEGREEGISAQATVMLKK